MKTPREIFFGFINTQDYDGAAAYVKQQPEVARINSAFLRVLETNHYDLVAECLKHGANPYLTPSGNDALSRAAKAGPDGLRAVLDHLPGVIQHVDSSWPALSSAFWAGETDRTKAQSSKKCIRMLLEAGVLDTRDDKGQSLFSGAVMNTTTGNYHRALLDWGADMQSVFFGTADPYKVIGIDETRRAELIERWKKLQAVVGETEEKACRFMRSAMDPKPLFNWLINDAEGRYRNHLLSANRTGVLLQPEYWREQGGIKKALKHVEQVEESLPPYLHGLRGRFDLSGLEREEKLPREGSVTVGYVRGSAATASKDV